MILELKDICKDYIQGKMVIPVLKHIDFQMEKGEYVAIMGPSGSGKSTLLYSVSGMDQPTAGKVYLGGKQIASLPNKEMAKIRLNEMGFIFQQMQMLHNLSVLDNILLPAYQSKEKGRSKQEILEYGKQLMKKFDILQVADNNISEVSGGQLQRACICRSLINHPSILFADEPTGALNRGASESVLSMMEQINEEGTTILMVTHDMHVASKCGRILYIEDGNIKGELSLMDKKKEDNKAREHVLSAWLSDMEW